MNRRNFVVKHKTAHHRQIFLLKFARPPPTTIRTKAKFTSEVWNYPVNVPTARQDRNARMATVQFVGKLDLVKFTRQPRQVVFCL
jgi:hypothetical protein